MWEKLRTLDDVTIKQGLKPFLNVYEIEAVLKRRQKLVAYFQSEVIRGADAFTEVALGFQEFEQAMIRKLLKELQGLSVSGLAPPREPG